MTTNELRSVSGYTGWVILPTADGTIDIGDQRHVAGYFPSQLASGGAPVVEASAIWRPTIRVRRR